MPISKRTLTKWRKEALKNAEELKGNVYSGSGITKMTLQASQILLLTQELLDQQLLKEK